MGIEQLIFTCYSQKRTKMIVVSPESIGSITSGLLLEAEKYIYFMLIPGEN